MTKFVLPISWEQYLRSHQFDELKRYSEVTEKYLDKAREDFEAWSSQQAASLPEEKRQEFYDTYNDDYWEYQDKFPMILHNSLFMSIISLLEYEVSDSCRTLKHYKDLQITLSDLKGDLPDRTRKYLMNARMIISSLDPFWQEINKYYLVRNCIAHNHGMVKSFNKEDDLRAYLNSKNIISKDTIVEEVALTSQFCSDVVENIQNFLIELSKIVIGES